MQFLDFEISIVGKISDQEIQDLINRHEICSLAKEKLVKGQILWEEYLDLIETAGIDIDQFLNEANDDAILMGF